MKHLTSLLIATTMVFSISLTSFCSDIVDTMETIANACNTSAEYLHGINESLEPIREDLHNIKDAFDAINEITESCIIN